MERLSLRPHRWDHFPAWVGNRWRWTTACPFCGLKFEWARRRQICLGVVGELLLAGEKVPKQWARDFDERRRVSRRAWRTKAKR